MGMFDDLRCEYPLPAPGANELSFQTKDTPAQWCDLYVIRADGTLWHEEYETEDRSDPDAEGLEALIGLMTRVNERWVQCEKFTGEIRFYDFINAKDNGGKDTAWIEFSSYFINGKLQSLVLLEDTRNPVSPK